MDIRTSAIRAIILLLVLLGAAADGRGQQNAPLGAVPPKEGDYIVKDFTFSDGQTLPEVKLHYTTLGTPRRDASGRTTNAVVILHGTNRRGGVFLVPSFAGALFNQGQLLDTSKYYVILPDQLAAGAGKSTKPSDGLRAKFPKYDYSDMVKAMQILLKDGLQVNHLKLIVGASMGCMEGFMWAESNPDDMDGLLLLSCLPTEIAGRNRMVRKLMIDDVKNDPGWHNGNYTQQPYGLRAALGHLLVVGSVPTLWQKEYPTAAAADKYLDQYIEDNMKSTDANDFMYQYDASRNYNPQKDLGKIKAKLLLINPQEDFWNPAELGIAEQEIEKVKNGRFVQLPFGDLNRGHYTFFQAAFWQKHLAEFLGVLKP